MASSHWFEHLEDEDYWNSSNTSGFDFDEVNSSKPKKILEEQTSPKILHKRDNIETKSFQEIRTVNANDVQIFTNATKSRNVLENINSKNIQTDSNISLLNNPEKCILSLIRGRSCSIRNFKAKDSKLELLNAAIKYGDGNIITTIVLFLKQTLCSKLFIYEICKRPAAINHYKNYLSERKQFSELSEFLSTIGQQEEVALVEYIQAIKKKDVSFKLRQLKKCKENWFGGYSGNFEVGLQFWNSIVSEHINLLERQRPIEMEDLRRKTEIATKENSHDMLKDHKSLLEMPVITTLFYCCLNHFDLSENNLASPKAISKTCNLTEKQYIWTALRALAQTQRWIEIDSLFEYKSWIGGKKIKTHIPFQKVSRILRQATAPNNVLMKYVNFIENTEVKLNLAQEYKLHEIVINILVSIKDRIRLVAYQKKLLAQGCMEYTYAENALKQSTTKWKN